jgi:predicted DNA binding protein
MIEACLQVSSEGYYSCEITGSLPVKVSIIAINGPVGFGIIEALDGNEETLVDYVSEMRSSGSILSFEVTHATPTLYWTRAEHEMDGESIHETILSTGCMNRLPIIIQNGKQDHTVLAPSREAFRSMYDILNHRFSGVEVRRVSQSPVGELFPQLTKKQAEAFRLAFKSGYYSIPRGVTLEMLSGSLGIKRVAMQERLRRAERAILSDYASKYL